ncbi:MAG: CARDB domain-containing protein, partial [bacterium]
AVGPEVQADNIGKVYVGAKASEAEVKARYDGLYWFVFRDFGFRHGLLDSLMTSPRASYHAFSHARSALTGKRFNGRVTSGDAGLDTQAYAYEFEDPATGRRIWVAWRSDGREAEVALPCRVDSLATTELAYGPSTEVRAAAAGADGWLRIRVGARPVFVSEPATARISRPDVVVDSLRVTTPAPRAGERLDVVVYLRNVGNRPTPAGSPVAVVLSMDDAEAGRATVRSRVTDATTVTVSVRLPASAAGSRLLSAVANPDARFVELDTDNNTAYLRLAVLPQGR